MGKHEFVTGLEFVGFIKNTNHIPAGQQGSFKLWCVLASPKLMGMMNQIESKHLNKKSVE